MKSACYFCPFNALKADAIERHKAHPEQVADALMLEHVCLSLNPRGTLYRDKSLIQITMSSGGGVASSDQIRISKRQASQTNPRAEEIVENIHNPDFFVNSEPYVSFQ
jgi:hypothetical protein